MLRDGTLHRFLLLGLGQLGAASLVLGLAPGARAEAPRSQIEEVIVTGERPAKPSVGPRTYVEALEAEAINVATVEDFIAYEPSLIVRRRFIGDPNGTLGIRGSNQFQTTRSMVFADGVPLHYLLETSFSGAPRWSLVAPDEVRGVEVLYGPFSAEYGGNSMGGVVNIETELPAERSFHIEGAGFSQDYDPKDFGALGSRESFGGRRLQASYGDRIGNLSFYLSHSHLNNESQPLTNRSTVILADAAPASVVDVTGAQIEQDSKGKDVIYFGDTGPEEVTTNLTKLKLGYTVGDWLGRLTVAYEDRKREVEGPENFLRDAAGNPVFGNGLRFEGKVFNVPASMFEISFQERDTLLVGAGLDGPVGNGWNLELDFSVFDILRDENRRSGGDVDNVGVNLANASEAFTGQGRLTRFADTGWVTGDLKLRTESFAGRSDMRFVTGVHYDYYELELQDFSTTRFRSESGRAVRSLSGGETRTQAAFAQWGWQMTDRWDVELGVRAERWKASDGFFLTPTSNAENVQQEGRTETAISPKLSVGYAPNDTWSFRYSIAHATRFPVVAELFSNVQSFNSASIANPGLDPEEGLHHNFMIERQLANGYLRTNLYRETIRDVIFSQTVQNAALMSGARGQINTFLPIDEEVVHGAEMIVSLRGLLNGKVDLQANLDYTRARIRKNDLDESIEGNDFPRQPEWRGNLLLTYSWSPRFKTSAGLRYASDSFDELDNSDRKDGVFGAQDAYRFVNLKATYQLTETASLGFGVDNVTNEEAYVFHPWPARTAYAEFSLTY
jgi:iron complex outermembrane recepter protein